MKWVTRQNAKVDRIACAWLIRRFVDPAAEFEFVPRDVVGVTSERTGAIPFDMPGYPLYHRDSESTFEAIVREHRLDSHPGVAAMARIVHAADVERDVATAPEGAGLAALAAGFALVHGHDDQRKLREELPMYDALHAWCCRTAQAPAEL
jgi:hypothetical protein